MKKRYDVKLSLTVSVYATSEDNAIYEAIGMVDSHGADSYIQDAEAEIDLDGDDWGGDDYD